MLQQFIQQSRYIRLIPYLFLIIIVCLSFAVYRYAFNIIENEHQQVFQEKADDIKTRIESRLVRYDLLLRGLRGLFEASSSVERDEFKAYVNAINLPQYFPGTLGIGYAVIFPKDQKNEFVTKIKQEGFTDFVIHPQGEREVYSAIYFIEPFEGANLNAFGYDMYSEPVRHKAMERAWQENATSMSGPVTLIQEKSLTMQQKGFLFYLPVYRNHMIIQTLEDRMKAHLGWVYVPLRVDDMISALLGDQLKSISLKIFDVENSTEGRKLIFDGFKYLENKDIEFEYHALHQINLFGRQWFIEIQMADDNSNVYLPLLILISGIVIAILMFLMMSNLIAIQQKAQQIAIKMNEQLEKSHGQLKAINDAATIGIYVTDNEGKCTYVNEQYKKTLGVGFDQIQGIGWSKFLHLEDSQRVFSLWQDTVLSGGEFNSTYRFVQPSGKVIWVKGKATELLINGKKSGYIGTIEDITDIYTKEIALKESETRLRAIIDNALAPIIVCDMNWKVINWNKQAEQVFGYSIDELIGQNFVNLMVDQRDKYLLNQTIKFIASDDSGERHQQKVEVRLITKNGKLLDIEISLNAIISDQNYLISMFIRNITEEKERIALEEQRIKTIERMNRLMVDREIKMVELKKKIKALGASDDVA